MSAPDYEAITAELYDALSRVTLAAEEAANVLAPSFPGFAEIVRANANVGRAALAKATRPRLTRDEEAMRRG